MPQLEVKSTGSPMADMKRLECLNEVNALTDTEIKNLTKLVKSPKARNYLRNDLQFAKLKMFI
ncbi:hypothetical protein [Flagellimonas marina]|uniref:Uncharacterized protein n=1 Tax=Flagellimonas marina TaxID=1775168 RepID=A0ABV8PHM4_9FLAO